MLKLKIALVDADTSYVSRLVARFHEKYGATVEIAAFGSVDNALDALKTRNFNVLLVDAAFSDEQERLPKDTCVVAYLVSEAFSTFKGLPAVRKYQRVDDIYQQVSELRIENMPEAEVIIEGSSESAVAVFIPATGGVGASTVAAAAAMALASQGRRVLYLNMEDFGDSACYFEGEGAAGFDDVLLALKRKKGNVALKVRGAIRHDVSGVGFIASSRNPSDILDLTPEDIVSLLQELVGLKEFEYIIVDVSMDLSERTIAFLKFANQVFFVSNGTVVANVKTKRMVEAVSRMEEDGGFKLSANTKLLYNDFHKSSCKMLDGVLPVAGGLPHFAITDPRSLVQALSTHELFTRLLGGAS